MKRHKLLLCVLCLMAAMSTPVFAGDMEMPGVKPPPPPPPTQGRIAEPAQTGPGLIAAEFPSLTELAFNCFMTINVIL